MRKLVVLAAVCAGTMLLATPESAKADHLSHSGGYGYGPGYGGYDSIGGYGAGYGSYGAGYGDYGGGLGGYGGIRSTPYGGYCSDGSFGSRFIDPYRGVRPRGYGHNHYDFQLRTGRFGLYFRR